MVTRADLCLWCFFGPKNCLKVDKIECTKNRRFDECVCYLSLDVIQHLEREFWICEISSHLRWEFSLSSLSLFFFCLNSRFVNLTTIDSCSFPTASSSLIGQWFQFYLSIFVVRINENNSRSSDWELSKRTKKTEKSILLSLSLFLALNSYYPLTCFYLNDFRLVILLHLLFNILFERFDAKERYEVWRNLI